MRFFIYSIIFISMVNFANSLCAQQIKVVPNDSLQKELSALKDSLTSRLDKLNDSIHEQEIKFADQHITRANRIIDWSAMVFTGFAILLVVAGVAGLKEFSRLRQTEKKIEEIQHRMKLMLNQVNKELKKIQSKRKSILELTKQFVEETYYFNEGLQEYHYGNYQGARKLLYRSVDLNNKNTHALYYIAKSYLRENDIDTSKKIFYRIIELEPDNSYAYQGLARVYKETNNKKSESYYKKAVTLDPNNYKAYNGFGTLLRENGKLEEALQSYFKSHNLFQRSSTAFNIGMLYYSKFDLTNAFIHLNESKYLCYKEIEKSQSPHWAYIRLGVILGLEGYLEGAKDCFIKGKKYNPTATSAISLLDYLESLRKNEFKDRSKNDKENLLQIITCLKDLDFTE